MRPWRQVCAEFSRSATRRHFTEQHWARAMRQMCVRFAPSNDGGTDRLEIERPLHALAFSRVWRLLQGRRVVVAAAEVAFAGRYATLRLTVREANGASLTARRARRVHALLVGALAPVASVRRHRVHKAGPRGGLWSRAC